MRIGFQQAISRTVSWLRSDRGAAAAEFAILLPFLTIPMLSVVDLGYYAYQRMQVGNAAVIGAEEARSFCTPAQTPATDSTKCPGFQANETAAIHSTSLGTNVALVSGYPIEAYYCTLTTGALQQVGTSGTFGSPPTPPSPDTCDAVTNHSVANGVAPSDYIQVQVTYTYTSVFPGMTVAALLPGTVTQTSWSRLD
jgi:Flp pilus assembly protein TadG